MSTTAPVRPLSDRVIVRRIPEADVTESGLIIPTQAKERPMTGTVVAVGPGRRTEAGLLITPDVKEGDVVLFGKMSGQEIKDHENPKDNVLIMREDEILGVLLVGGTKVSAGKKDIVWGEKSSLAVEE